MVASQSMDRKLIEIQQSNNQMNDQLNNSNHQLNP